MIDDDNDYDVSDNDNDVSDDDDVVDNDDDDDVGDNDDDNDDEQRNHNRLEYMDAIHGSLNKLDLEQ